MNRMSYEQAKAWLSTKGGCVEQESLSGGTLYNVKACGLGSSFAIMEDEEEPEKEYKDGFVDAVKNLQLRLGPLAK